MIKFLATDQEIQNLALPVPVLAVELGVTAFFTADRIKYIGLNVHETGDPAAGHPDLGTGRLTVTAFRTLTFLFQKFFTTN